MLLVKGSRSVIGLYVKGSVKDHAGATNIMMSHKNVYYTKRCRSMGAWREDHGSVWTHLERSRLSLLDM